MNSAFPRTSFGEAFGFGWRALPNIIREQWPYLLILLGAGVAWTVFSSNGSSFHSAQIEPLVLFPSLVVSARMLDPAYRLNASIVLGVCGIWAIFIFAFVVAFGPAILAILFRQFAVLWIYVAIVPLTVWIGVKLTLTPVVYAFQPEGERNIIAAFRTCWSQVSGDTWWRIVGIGFVIGLCLGFPAGLISLSVFMSMHQANLPLAVAVATTIYYCGSLPATAWINAAYVSMVGGVPQQAFELA